MGDGLSEHSVSICAWRRKLCLYISKHIWIVLMSQTEAAICRHVTMPKIRTVRHRTRPDVYSVRT